MYEKAPVCPELFCCIGNSAMAGFFFRHPTYDIIKKEFIMFPFEPISAKSLDYYVGRSDALIIDLRDKESYEKSHIRTAIHIPYSELEEKGQFPKGKILIFYCDRGGASILAAKQMAKKGYETRSVIGGFELYRGRNLVIL